MDEKILWCTFLAFILVICFIFCWNQWKMVRKYRYLPSKGMDVGWIFRVILQKHRKNAFAKLLLPKLLKTANEFQEEGLHVFWLHKPIVFIHHEKHMKNILNKVELLDKGFFYEFNRKMFGNGLLSSNYELWKVHRKLLNPAFSVGVLKCKMDVFNEYARQLTDKLDKFKNKPGDKAWKAIQKCAFQNMADFVLGLNLNNEKHVNVTEKFMQTVDNGAEMSFERVTCPWLKWDFMLPFFPFGRKYLKIVDDINQFAEEIMTEMKDKKSNREDPDDDSHVSNSLWDIFMKLYLQGHVFTKKDVRDQLVTFMSAGYETVSVSMLWCFYTLGHYPEVQEKAYNEILLTVPEGDVTYEDLIKLKYLECVIKETMRLHAIVPVFSRKASENIQLGKYIIPRGADVGIITSIMHKDSNVFPEPKKFDPERFSDNSALRPWMYIPFAEGYRNCIGKKMAMMEIKVQLAHVLRRFRIKSLNRVNDSDLIWSITLKPEKPLQFSFENRHFKS